MGHELDQHHLGLQMAVACRRSHEGYEGHEDAPDMTIFNLRELPFLRDLRGDGFLDRRSSSNTFQVKSRSDLAGLGEGI